MAVQQPLQGGVQFQDLRSDPKFMAAPPVEQMQYLMEHYLPANDPAFEKASIQEKQQYIQEVVMPQIQAEPPQAAYGSLQGAQRPQAEFVDNSKPMTSGIPSFSPGVAGMSNFAPASVEDIRPMTAGQAFGFGQALKGATLGYLDPTQAIQAMYPEQDLSRLQQSPIAGIPEFAGSTLPLMGIGAAVEGLAPMNPLTARIFGTTAEAAGQRVPLLSQMARGAAEVGAWEALKSQPGHQFDLGQRALHGLEGAAMGAAFPASIAGAGRVLKGGVKAVQSAWQEFFGPNTHELLQAHTKALKEAARKEAMKTFESLAEIFGQLQRGEIDRDLIDANDFARLVTKMDELAQALTQGRPVRKTDLSAARNTGTLIRSKVKVRAKKFIPADDNSINHGQLTDEMAEAISAKLGQPFKAGALRIEKQSIPHALPHDKDAQRKGFKNSLDLAKYVLRNFNAIYEGKTLKHGDKSLILAVKKEGHITYIEIAPSKGYYRVNSSHPINPKRLDKKTPLWEGERSPQATRSGSDVSSQGSPEVTGKASPSAETQSGTIQNITPKKPLQGSVKEMVAQVEQAAGLPENAGSLTVGQLEKQMGQKLTEAQKDIHANLRAVARAEVQDASKGIYRQLPLDSRALKFQDVEANISDPFQATAKIIDDAMSQGKAVRVEYVAEEAGRSMEAAKVTAKGNVKVETTTFTPLYWGKTKEGKVLLHGYNQRGHFTTYHLEPSPNGSQILKARATDKAPFVGEYSNVYLGQRPFLAKDVLSRGVRSAEGAIKTSEALQNATDFATLFKSETIKQFNKPTQKMLNAAKKRGRFDEATLKTVLKQIEKDKEDMVKLCNLFGLKV